MLEFDKVCMQLLQLQRPRSPSTPSPSTSLVGSGSQAVLQRSFWTSVSN